MAKKSKSCSKAKVKSGPRKGKCRLHKAAKRASKTEKMYFGKTLRLSRQRTR